MAVRVDFDEEAARRLGDLAEQLDVGDLERAGWDISFPEVPAGRGSSVRAVRKFETPAEASTALSQLTGSNGPFRDVQLRQDRSALATRTTLSGTLDLTGGLDAFGDDGLLRATGSRTGLSGAVTDRPPAEAVGMRMRASLPGAPLDYRWDPRPGERVALDAAATSTNLRGIGAALGAIGSLAALVWLLIGRRRRRTVIPPP